MTLVLAPATFAASVVFSLPATGNANVATRFSWSVSGGSTPAYALLQRQQGMKRVWRTVARLRGDSGSGAIPPLAIGAYSLRVALYLGSRVEAAHSHTLRVFGEVPLSAMCSGFTLPDDNINSCKADNGVATIGQNAFPYVANLSSNADGGLTTLTASKTTCRSIALQFGIAQTEAEQGDIVSLAVYQSSLDPISASVPDNTIGSLNATLDGGPWQLHATNTVEVGGSYNLLVSGHASCYTSTGI